MSKATMPSPSAYLYTTPSGARVVDLKRVDLDTPGLAISELITTTQAEAYADAVRREALEEAAQACEARIGTGCPGIGTEEYDQEAQECAQAIRALIPPTKNEAEE